MICSRSLVEMNILGTEVKRDQRLSQNSPLDFDDAAYKEVPAQGATASDIAREQRGDKLDRFWVCLFELDDISDETVEGFDGVLVEQGIEVLRELSPLARCPPISC